MYTTWINQSVSYKSGSIISCSVNQLVLTLLCPPVRPPVFLLVCLTLLVDALVSWSGAQLIFFLRRKRQMNRAFQRSIEFESQLNHWIRDINSWRVVSAVAAAARALWKRNETKLEVFRTRDGEGLIAERLLLKVCCHRGLQLVKIY